MNYSKPHANNSIKEKAQKLILKQLITFNIYLFLDYSNTKSFPNTEIGNAACFFSLSESFERTDESLTSRLKSR